MTGADLSDALSDMWRSVLLFVPTALAFLAILLLGYLLARLVRTVVAKTLRRIGFDRAVERGAIGKALGGRVEPSDLCAKIAFYAVLLFALQLGFGIWGPNAVSDLLTALVAWLPRAFVAIVIIVVAAAIGGAARDLIGSALGGLAYGRVLAQGAYWLIVALGVIAALEQVQIATAVTQPVLIAVLATVAGVVIVGVGGGLVRPMQRRWEIWLERASTESAAIREHARSYADERARVAAEQKAAEEAAAQAAAAKAGQDARLAEQARIAEAERVARAEAVAGAERVAAQRAAAEAERQRALEAAAAEQTQVIPVRQPRTQGDDLPHPVPGFDDPDRTLDTGAAADTTTSLGSGPETTTSLGSGPETTTSLSDGPDIAAGDGERDSSAPAVESGGPGRAAGDPATAAGGPGGAAAAESERGRGAGGRGASATPGTETGGAAEADSDRGAAAGGRDDSVAEESGTAAEESGTAADVSPEAGEAPASTADPDVTTALPSSERRQAVPRQAGADDGEKTQVIRGRRGDERKP